jgi:hypothetical protein
MMTDRSFRLDPRMFVTGPFELCSRCGTRELGTLSITNNFHLRRCRNCFHNEGERLPRLRKKLIYLDQMVLSNIAKELDPVWRGHTRRPDPFWVDLFDQLDRLVKLQLIVCPESPIHEEESCVGFTNTSPAVQPELSSSGAHSAAMGGTGRQL